MTNTKINFCGVEFKNPIVTASGTFGFGMEYNEFVSIEEYGGCLLYTSDAADD